MLRGLLLVATGLAACEACAACDGSGPPAGDDASRAVPAPSAAASPSSSAPSVFAYKTERVMPPRPVPTSSPTVRITMPRDVQLLAIQYMAAMQTPQSSDAQADPDYAKQVADQLRPVGKTDVVSSGRRIDIVLDKGCDATLPRESVARRTGASLPLLLAHGVLVVRCADRVVQCLQSTRDAMDVLCTHK